MKNAIGAGDTTHLAGLWVGTVDGITLATWMVAARQARIAPLAMIPDEEGKVSLKGELLVRADRVSGYINRGPHGVGDCAADPRVKLPRFVLTCAAERTDASALIQVGAFPPGRILGPTVLTLRVSPNGTLPKHYVRPDPPGMAKTADAGSD